MATRLKDLYGPEIPASIAAAIAAVHPPFRADAFLEDALDGYESLELTPRARHIADALARHLPTAYGDAIDILLASLGPPLDGDEAFGMEPFLYAPHVYFVAAHGIDHWDTSMRAQYELTQRFTAEYSIRVFIEGEPERTLARLREWADDPSPHVRRLVSEGTRTRLPWAPRLRRFQADPSPVLGLLELLKDDPSLYVRRSVANNLNDIGKDHPDLLVETCERWLVDASAERRWLVRHALRSAVKRADRAALALLGFGDDRVAALTGIMIMPLRARIGDNLRVTLTVENAGQSSALFNVDLRVHFVKVSGRLSPRVFKLREVDLRPGERATLSKVISLRQQTTRTHHPGEHRVEAVINGAATPIGSFYIE
jgi:3-methyladenine DNA glycosylase AlkC